MFTVIVEDSFDRVFGGHDKVGEYQTYEEAVAKAMSLIDRTIRERYQAGMTAQELYWSVSQFDSPAIVPDREDHPFSPAAYTRDRCRAMAEPGGAAPAS